VPLDKSEGAVKDKLLLSVFFAPLFSPERLRTKTLEISRQSPAVVILLRKTVPPTIDSA
jgi:hypothetical protein